ncbi:PPOX class F420-dependent oxidoreductase [Tengunoibacter tsumagoiensis]|uniref:Putative pyridoxamine 5'-phosphate oxidase n=1 Tax=Tengunoibacter tsumagoiensis TaxID=2014871 RepID=A0A401ZV45_9CHLR|nr:PPOX class F420-dependent oxidoreductase [Tengunoibacter tsumagoiensis]GCE10763.1 putative pyridoxamine 5'-phosphate oxidase [Tengunoibacter tsumagoiensis]
MGLIPEQHQNILKSVAFAHIATVGPDGSPQSSPVWFDWDGTYLRFGHTRKGQKFHNLQREPRVALSILDPENAYHYLELRGKVIKIEDDTDNHFVNAMAKRYMGLDVYPYRQPTDQGIIVTIKPEHFTAMG